MQLCGLIPVFADDNSINFSNTLSRIKVLKSARIREIYSLNSTRKGSDSRNSLVLSDNRKIQKIGGKIEHRLGYVIQDQLDYFDRKENRV